MKTKFDRIVAILLLLTCISSSMALFFKKSSIASKKESSDVSFNWEDGLNVGLGKTDIAVIDLVGPIMYGSMGGFGQNSNIDANQVLATLDKIEKDKVKAVFLRLNTPGGTASASQAIYEKMQTMKKKSNIKFYSFMQDVAASGGYYIASACDKIYANPSTMTGSIGVIMQVPNYTNVANKIGIETNTIKSGKFKDIGNSMRKMTEDEKKLLHDLIMDTYGEFVNAVSKGRKLPIEKVKELGDGRIYTGNQALKNHLVDKLGQESDALNDLAKELKIEGKPKTRNYTKSGFEKILGEIGAKSGIPSMENLINFVEISPKFQKIPLMLYK
ncbi:MAG: signal peptide peptidase SppA [Candidatus Sericytochromatia bacterium]